MRIADGLAYLFRRRRCPICGAHLRAFRPAGGRHRVLAEKNVIGAGFRRNALCPACGSLDRLRLVYLFLKSRPELISGARRLLHVAPEYHLGAWLSTITTLDYITADLTPIDLHLRIDITSIGHGDDSFDESFDAIICCHVLEHILDDRKAMSELHRVLTPGGWAILQVPIMPGASTYEDAAITGMRERERAFGQGDHVRIYGMDYVDRLTAAGFLVEPFRWTTAPAQFGGAGNMFGLIPEEIVFLARKPTAGQI